MHTIFRHYVSDVARALCCPGQMKRQILRELRDNLAEYRGDGGEMTRSAVEVAFGRPEDYAREYVQSLTEEELEAALHRAKLVQIVTMIVCGLIILGVLAFAIVFAVLACQSRQTHYTEEVFETANIAKMILRHV